MSANPNFLEVTTILRLPSLIKITGKSRSGCYRDIAAGLLPHPVKLGLRMKGWPASEIDAVNKARIAGKSDDEIKKLVTELEAARGKA